MSPPRETGGAAVIPCLDVSTWGGEPYTACWRRVDVNRWWITIGPAAAAAESALGDHDPRSLPSSCLDHLAPVLNGELVHLSVELDLCGAWLTVANAGHCRPVALRRAGWVDLRGHPAPPLGSGHRRYRDDRVGLGPGDALVLVPIRRHPLSVPVGRDGVHDEVLDVLLRLNLGQQGRSARAVAAALPAAADGRPLPPVVVIAVPTDIGEDRHAELAAALGVAPDQLELPGYPLGDLQPDLWSEPPDPPRTARITIPAGTAKLEEVRSLVLRMLASWRLEGRIAGEDVTLLATEVVANAMRHARTDATVTMCYTGPAVQISVRDGSPARPVVLPADERRRGGRGMLLVDAVAAAWGTQPVLDGKVVWFEVPLAPGR